MSSLEYPLKHVRLEQLHTAGFNIADFVCFPPNTLIGRKDELKTFFEKHRRISCRHFHADEANHYKCPVKYGVDDFNTAWEFCLLNNYGKNDTNTPYYTLCNESINTQESECAGNILFHDEYNWFIEYFYGPGTPRDVEKNVDRLKSYCKSYGSDPRGDRPPNQVLHLAADARKFQPIPGKAYIIEFSLYPYPIGRQRSHIICWEWRWGWLHYQLEANKHLLEENKRLKDRLDELETRLRIIGSSEQDLVRKTGALTSRSH